MRPLLVDWLATFMPRTVAALVAPTWFTCVGLAGLVTLVWMLRIGRAHRIDPGVIASIVLACYVAAVLAGIAVPMFLDTIEQKLAGGHVALRWSGMTSFWGYLAGLGAVAAACQAYRIPLARFGDLTAAPLGLALVFARLGCFLAGCDYGKVTSLPWALRFPAGSPAWRDHVQAGLVPASRAGSLPVHPTQLYEAALGLAIVGMALWVARTRWARAGHGRVFLAAAALYSAGRIGVETLRGDAGRGIYGGLSSGQIFSFVVIAAITGGLVWTRRRALHVVAAAALVLALAAPRHAHAQPAPATPPPPPGATQPPPVHAAAPPSDPLQPPGTALPVDPYASAPPTVRAAPTRPRPSLEVGVLFGIATPLNRRPEQVGMLAGPSLSAGLTFGHAGVWLDFDSYGNQDASHGTVLVSGSVIGEPRDRLKLGGRVGFGATLVNFDEPAFRDITGSTARAEAIAEYRLGRTWTLWARPLSFDVLTAAGLGGPIVTWQMRIGLAYRLTGAP